MKPYKSVLLLTVFLLAQSFLHAQGFKVQKTTYQGNSDVDYSFPILEGNSKAVSQINNYLWIQWLQVLPTRDHPFREQDIPAAGQYNGTTYLGYKILRNDGKLFSIRMDNEYDGAGVNLYHQTYNFDAQTGSLVYVDHLLTEKRRKIMTKKLLTNRIQRLKNYLKTLDTTAHGNTEPETYQIYQSCLEDLTDPEASPWGGDMIIYPDSLSLTAPSCGSSHYFQAGDTADVYHNRLSYIELKPYLTKYGKGVLSPNEAYHPLPESARNVMGHVYKGTINRKYTITFMIPEIYLSKKSAVYFYDRHNQEINLEESTAIPDDIRPGMVLKFRRYNPEENNKPMNETFQLTVQKDLSLKGIWRDDKHTFPVDLKW